MEKRKKRFGDRSYARRVSMTGMQQISIDLKPNRCISDVYLNQKMDVTELSKYIEKKKKEGIRITYFEAFVTAIGKIMYNRKKLNYFVSNRRMYEHDEVVISFVAKESFSDKAEEIMILIPIDPNDNVYSIGKKISEKVKAGRNPEEQKKEGANGAIDIVSKLPNLIRVPIVGTIKFMDKKGFLPSFLIKDNLYYSSMIVSNLGAIKCGAIFHNINDFGVCSSLATMGEVKNDQVVDEKGNVKIRKVCEFGVNIDERIADGYYFAKSLQMVQHIFDNPSLLEDNANEKIEIGEIR